MTWPGAGRTSQRLPVAGKEPGANVGRGQRPRTGRLAGRMPTLKDARAWIDDRRSEPVNTPRALATRPHGREGARCARRRRTVTGASRAVDVVAMSLRRRRREGRQVERGRNDRTASQDEDRRPGPGSRHESADARPGRRPARGQRRERRPDDLGERREPGRESVRRLARTRPRGTVDEAKDPGSASSYGARVCPGARRRLEGRGSRTLEGRARKRSTRQRGGRRWWCVNDLLCEGR